MARGIKQLYRCRGCKNSTRVLRYSCSTGKNRYSGITRVQEYYRSTGIVQWTGVQGYYRCAGVVQVYKGSGAGVLQVCRSSTGLQR